MTKETHRFEVRETIRKMRVVFLSILVLLWVACLFRFCHDKLDHPGFVVWLGLFPPIFLSVVFLVTWLSIWNISYEISSVKILKKRGGKIVCSIDLCDVQTVILKEIVTLRVLGRKDFLFRGISTKSSRKRLLTVLRQLGIKKVEREKVKLTQVIIIVVAILCVTHYSASLTMWVAFTSLCLTLCRVGIDWPMFLHVIPAVAFLSMSAVTIWLACKRKRGAIILLGLTILASILCFIYENKNDFYQWEKGKYCTWWLCEVFDKPEKPASNSYSRTYYKYGYIDKAGNIIVEPEYDVAEAFSEGLACVGYRIKKEDADEEIAERQGWRFDLNFLPPLFGEVKDSVYLYGFINTQGEVVVEPQFDSADAFSEGLSKIEIGSKFGYINRSGEIVIEPQFDCRAGDFSEGFAVVCLNERYIFIDKQGEAAFPEQFDNTGRFSEGLAPVEIGDKWGYIDSTGQMVIKPQFDHVRCFSEGLAAVKINDKWGFINKTGNIVIEPQFGFAFGFHEDIGIVRLDSKWELIEKWGCIDKAGRIIIEPIFYCPPKFCGELGRVCYAKGWGYREKYWWKWIDKAGMAVNRPYFDKVYFFSEGLAEVQIDNKYGYINQNGELVIEPQFDTTGSFSEGLATVGVKIPKEGKNE